MNLVVFVVLYAKFIRENEFFRKRVDDLLATLDKKIDSHRETLDKLQQAFQQAQIKASLNQPKS